MASNDEYQQRQYWDKKGPTVQDYYDMVKILTERGELPVDLFAIPYDVNMFKDNELK